MDRCRHSRRRREAVTARHTRRYSGRVMDGRRRAPRSAAPRTPDSTGTRTPPTSTSTHQLRSRRLSAATNRLTTSDPSTYHRHVSVAHAFPGTVLRVSAVVRLDSYF